MTTTTNYFRSSGQFGCDSLEGRRCRHSLGFRRIISVLILSLLLSNSAFLFADEDKELTSGEVVKSIWAEKTAKIIPMTIGIKDKKLVSALITLYEADPSIWREDNLFLIAKLYVYERDLPKARSIVESLHMDYPERPGIWTALGDLSKFEGDTNKAIEVYGQVWTTLKSIDALERMAALTVEAKGLKGIKPFITDMKSNMSESVTIQKILLGYVLFLSKENKADARAMAEELLSKIDGDGVMKDETLFSFVAMIRANLLSDTDQAKADTGQPGR